MCAVTARRRGDGAETPSPASATPGVKQVSRAAMAFMRLMPGVHWYDWAAVAEFCAHLAVAAHTARDVRGDRQVCGDAVRR